MQEEDMSSVAQSAALREIFERVVAEVRPRRLAVLGPRLHLIGGDVLDVALAAEPRYDLIHGALLLEQVEPLPLLRRIEAWLGPSGVCSLVTQEPAGGLHAAGEIAALAEEAGFALASRRAMKLPSGKTLVSSLFDKARKTLGRRRGYARC
jgi:hypothetical protein